MFQLYLLQTHNTVFFNQGSAEPTGYTSGNQGFCRTTTGQ